jgi:hypothetical protein
LWLTYQVQDYAKRVCPRMENMSNLDLRIVDNHKQVYDYSCIPSSVELVLKLLGRLPYEDTSLQFSWGNRTGSFGELDNKEMNGVRFKRQFDYPRDDSFPIIELFDCIDKELSDGNLVIVSLLVAQSKTHAYFHMYVIHSKSNSGDYLAVTKKDHVQTEQIDDVKQRIKSIKGTDILTYEVIH